MPLLDKEKSVRLTDSRDRDQVERQAIGILLQAESKFSPNRLDRLKAILNFLGVICVNQEYKLVRFTCLHHAAWQGFSSLVEELLRLGAIPNRKSNSKKKYPPIFYALSSVVPSAVQKNPALRIKVVELLLPHHIDNIDEKCNGSTLFNKAVYGGHQDIARMLLENGANPVILTKQGEKPELNKEGVWVLTKTDSNG